MRMLQSDSGQSALEFILVMGAVAIGIVAAMYSLHSVVFSFLGGVCSTVDPIGAAAVPTLSCIVGS